MNHLIIEGLLETLSIINYDLVDFDLFGYSRKICYFRKKINILRYPILNDFE